MPFAPPQFGAQGVTKTSMDITPMEKKARKRALTILTVSLGLGACGGPPATFYQYETLTSQNPTLVTIDDSIHIRVSELIGRLDTSAVLVQGGAVDSATAYDTLRNVVLDSIISLAADTFKLESDASAKFEREIVHRDWAPRVWIQRNVVRHLEVDSADVDSFYFSRTDLFAAKARCDFAHIVISSLGYRFGPDSAKYANWSAAALDSMALAEVVALKAGIADSTDFFRVAREHSMHKPSAERGGKMGWNNRESVHSEIETVLYDSLTPLHKVIGPVVSPDGAHLLYIFDRTPAGCPPPTAEMRAEAAIVLINELTTGRLEEYVDSLRVARHFRFNDSALLLTDSALVDSLWVVTADGFDTLTGDEYRLAREVRNVGSRTPPTLEEAQAVARMKFSGDMLLKLAEDERVDTTVLYHEALDPYYHQLAVAAIHRAATGPIYTPDSATVDSAYVRDIDKYSPTRPIKVELFITSDSSLAEHVRSQLESGVDMKPVAEEFGFRKWDIGFIGPDYPDSSVYKLALYTPEGRVSGVTRLRDGFGVVKIVQLLREKHEAVAKGEIRKRLASEFQRAHKAAFLQRLWGSHRIVWHPVRFNGVRLRPHRERYPAAYPEGRARNTRGG